MTDPQGSDSLCPLSDAVREGEPVAVDIARSVDAERARALQAAQNRESEVAHRQRPLLRRFANQGDRETVAHIVVVDGPGQTKGALKWSPRDLMGLEVDELDGVGAEDDGRTVDRGAGLTLVHRGEFHPADRATPGLVGLDPRVHGALVVEHLALAGFRGVGLAAAGEQ